MSRRSAIWITALACGFIGFGLAADTSTALATEVTAQVTTGKWSDTVNVEWEPGKTATYTNTTTWAESFDGTYWSYSSFKGELSQTGTAPEPSKPDCSGQLSLTSANPGSQTAGEGGPGVGKVIRPEGTAPWEVQAFVPYFGSATYGGHEQSSSSSGICATQNIGVGYAPTEAEIWEPEGNALGYVFAHEGASYFAGTNAVFTGPGGPCYFVGSYGGNVVPFTNHAGAYTQPVKCESTGSITTSHPETWNATLEETVTLSVPGVISPTAPGPPSSSGSPPPKTPPITCPPGSKPKCVDTQTAQRDLIETLRQLPSQCGIATIGLTALITSMTAPETGATLVLGALAPVGGAVFGVAGTTCALLIKRAYDDAKIIQDPPRGGLGTLAEPAKTKGAGIRLPSCGRYARKLRSDCKRLQADELHYVMEVRKSVAIDGALLTTVDRITAADNARKANALKAQEKHATSLRSRLAAAVRGQHDAEKAIARFLEANKIGLQLSSSQDQLGISDAFSKLSELGISGPTAEGLAGLTLSATPVDFVQALAHGEG